MELTIYEEFRDLVPLAQSFEYEQLKENILRDGCTTPLDVWPHDGKQIIIDGHTRYKICRECGVDFSVREINFVDAEEAKIWIIKNQFGRRNLIPYQRAELVLVLEPLIAKKAKERQIAAQNNKAGRAVRENSREQVEGGRTDESLAKISGISSNSIRRAKVIKEHGTPEQIERARTGGRGNTINAIYTEIRHRDISEKPCGMGARIRLQKRRFSVQNLQRLEHRTRIYRKHPSSAQRRNEEVTAKELAALIDGREIGHELTYDEERQAAESGLAALYVPDLDYAMISGAINGKLDDLSAFDRVYVTRDGIFASWRCNEDTRPVCPLFQWAMKRAIRVDTEFNRIGDPYCEFTADIPHVKFHTYLIDAYDFRQKEVFCVGIAFNVADLPGGCNGA